MLVADRIDMKGIAVIATPSKSMNIALWVVQIIVALAFFAAGSAKIAGVQMLVDVFARLGLGQGFRYVTACVEIIGALAVLTPRFSGLGALWLAATMVCAILAHIFIIGGNGGPAAVLLVLTLIIAYFRHGGIPLPASRSIA